MRKVALIGTDGQLGSDIKRVIPAQELEPLTVRDIDITDFTSTRSLFEKIKPSAIVNTAAYHKVDVCEENETEAFKVNAFAVKNLALICRDLNIPLLHISTDYVFDGTKKTPYLEEDRPQPVNAYGLSKLAGEVFIQYIWHKHFVVRTSGLYGVAGCMGKGGGNFVVNIINKAEKEKKLKIVDDEILTPTYTYELAKKIIELLKTEKYGLYHMTNQGGCSWWEFASKIFEYLGSDIEIEKISSENTKAKVKRPAYSVLENKHLKEIGLKDLSPWQDALKAFLKEKKYIS